MRILPLFIPHLGCRYNCVFCDQFATSAQSEPLAPLSIPTLVDAALASGPLDEVAFYGGSFTAMPVDLVAAYLDTLKPYIASSVVNGVRLSTRPDAITPQIVDLLALAGVTTVELGCQSFSDRVLEQSGRGHDAAAIDKAVALLRDKEFNVGLQLMPGLPGSDLDEALSSLASALLLKPDFLRVYPTIVFRGTALESLWSTGKFIPLELDEAVDLCADMTLVAETAKVPIIRFGLQANEGLEAGRVVSGPYHPAFGQLIKSRLWLRALCWLQKRGRITVRVHPDELSDAAGHKRSNILSLRQLSSQFAIVSDPAVKRGSVASGEEMFVMADLCRDTNGVI